MTGDGQLTGQWAVIAGGSKGIGLGIAERFVEAGANVLISSRGAEALEAAVAGLRDRARQGQHVAGLTSDMGDRDSVRALFEAVEERTDHLNVFVANAGTGQVTPFLELTDDEFDRVLALNFTGAVLGCQLAARAMVRRPQENQSIIAVSSIRALGPRPGRLIYAATKAALNQAVRVAATELASHGIRINTLSPGITETPLTAANPEAFEEAVKNVPLGRAGLPADLGEAALFLASPASKFITGANLVVDGGESLS